MRTARNCKGKELKARIKNMKNSRNKNIKSLFILGIILISGLVMSVRTTSARGDSLKDPIVTYIKTDGLYFSYLNNGESVKAHEGEDFSVPIISKEGSYIAYTHGNDFYIFDIKNKKYQKVADEILSYDWIDDTNIIYSTNENGLKKLNMENMKTLNHDDEYYYSNLKASKNNLIYGKRISKWTTEEGDFSFNTGIVEINLNEYDLRNKEFTTDIIIEGKKSTDEIIGYDPTISNITEDGRYIYIMEKFSSASLSADYAGIGIYDVDNRTHIDFTNIYGDENEELIVLPYKNNLAINPKNNNLISVIIGQGREMIDNKEAILLDINKNKTYRIFNFMDKDLVAMTPSFTVNGDKLLFSATKNIDISKEIDYNYAFKDWYNQPHNIYEYDLESSEIKKITKDDYFDFMPISIGEDTILFSRYKGDGHYSLMKLADGKEEIIAENIIFENEGNLGFYGYIKIEKATDIFK
ncbi:hypothetical protein [Tissierella praeacuta]|uniref:hypothetical protein n=1 Tax=Tissierella praeacuta TaxID=43131 RepID=UPI003340063E